MFGVVLQTALDVRGDRDGLVLQLRSQPSMANSWGEGRVVITPDRLGSSGPLEQTVRDIVGRAGYPSAVTTRDRTSAGFEAFSQTALVYLNHSQNKRYAVLYIPPMSDR